MKKIDLKEYIENKKVLSGREKGKNLRLRLKIDEEDNKEETVEINIPKEVFAFNSSYFLGLFGESVRKFGKDKFLEKYKFICTNIIMLNILDGIEDALNNVDLLGGE
ncbi:MAG: hypothetical protein J6J60_09240 [Clostridia bacterium]|nr:hypothetical protein [Clostridia bacterium]